MDYKIRGIVCPNLNVDIIVGLDCLKQLKPAVDWDSSVLTVLKNSVNYKVYPSSADSRIKDFIFVKIVKTNKSSNNKSDLNNYCFKAIHFYKVETCDYDDLPVV